MSMQTMRVCDFVKKGDRPEVCLRPFAGVCPICEQDRCSKHMEGTVGSSVDNRHPIRGNKSVGSTHVANVCLDCSDQIGDSLAAGALDEVLRKINGDIIEAIRAALAEKATKP